MSDMISDMNMLNIVLPEPVFLYFEGEAKRQGIDISVCCANRLTEHWINEHIVRPTPNNNQSSNISRSSQGGSGRGIARFDVAHSLPFFPQESQQWAQRIVDEALKRSGVTARKSNRGDGVTFEPNFIAIEYLRKRQPGVGLSLGAPVGRFKNAPASLIKGRTHSWSRILVDSDQVLHESLDLVQQAADIWVAKHPSGP
jgi:hypothetical protein